MKAGLNKPDSYRQNNENGYAVSDHALIRYLERKVGLDFADYRNEILSVELQHAISTCGDGKYPLGDGLRAVVLNGVVVTILTGNENV